MRAVILGGGGFLGRHLTRLLSDDPGMSVTAAGRRPASDAWKAFVGSRPNASFAAGVDVSSPAVQELVHGADVVFNLAVYGSYAEADFETSKAVNAAGAMNVAACCDAGGAGALVHVSSVAALGLPKPGQTFEETAAFDWENMRQNPYMRAKRMGQDAVLGYPAKRTRIMAGLPTLIMGPEDKENCLAFFRMAAKSPVIVSPPGSTCVADVRDVAAGLAAIAKNGAAGNAYLIGGENVSFPSLFRAIAEALRTGKPVVTIPRAMREPLYGLVGLLERCKLAGGGSAAKLDVSFADRPVSTAKLRALGWKPAHTLKETVSDAAAWYRAERLL